jgi:hypothetical protein
MVTKREELISDHSPKASAPIEYLTENGFSIIRRCDLDDSISASGTKHFFIVRDPHGYELEIVVEIADEAVSEIIWRSRGRLSLASSYWVALAERHLADYLWNNDDYPPDASLMVDQLTIDDVNLAPRWDRETLSFWRGEVTRK